MLGGHHVGLTAGHQLTVALQPRSQLEALAALLAAPERGSTRGALLLQCVSDAVEGCQQRLQVKQLPAQRTGLRQLAGDDLTMKQVERGVYERAAIARGDLQLFVGLLDRLQPQDVLHEPSVRATDPGLQPRRRHRIAAQRINIKTTEVAVELREQR